ncbi:Tfp pilus assembly protein FimT/FimU [Pseudomonas luteola]
MNKKRQQGFTLVEIMMVACIAVILAMIAFQERTLTFEQERARALGGELLKFNNAVRDYVSFYSGDANYRARAGVKTGVNWLKSASCSTGGAVPVNENKNGFLPCDFLATTAGSTTYGRLTFTTTIAAPANKDHVLETTTKMSLLKISGRERGDLSGLAALVAGGASAMIYQPQQVTTDGTAIYCLSEKASGCSGNRGLIVMHTSNDATNDTWLRTDGSNKMNSNISFKQGNPEGSRQIQNVSRLFNTDGIYLYLGNKTGDEPTLLNSGVVVDSDAEIMGSLYVNRIVDRNDSRYYIDPNGASNINTLKANIVNANEVDAKFVNVNGNVHAKSFVDYDDTNYRMDPNGISKINDVYMAKLHGDGKVDSQGRAMQNALVLSGNADIDGLKIKTKSGNLVNLSDLLPEYVSKEVYSVPVNSTVPYPKCGAGGQAKIVVTPMNMESSDKFDASFTVSADQAPFSAPINISGYTSGRSYMYAEETGGGWIVRGAATEGRTANSGYALASTFCVY